MDTYWDMERKRGGRRKYWVLSGIWIRRGEEGVDTYWDMERKRGGSSGYLLGYGKEEGRKY